MVITSLFMKIDFTRLEEIEKTLSLMNGVEVHVKNSEKSLLIVTTETEKPGEEETLYRKLEAIDGVKYVQIHMMYNEDDLIDLINKQKNDYIDILNDENIKPEDMKYGGHVKD